MRRHNFKGGDAGTILILGLREASRKNFGSRHDFRKFYGENWGRGKGEFKKIEISPPISILLQKKKILHKNNNKILLSVGLPQYQGSNEGIIKMGRISENAN